MYTDKQENGQLAHFISVLFDDDQFTFRYSSLAQGAGRGGERREEREEER